MAEKAILVTSSNVEELNKRYHEIGTGVLVTPGYWLVAPYRQLDGPYELLTKINFEKTYRIVGDIRNGFKEVERINV